MMVKTQIENRGIQDENILRVMRETPRHLFVPKYLKDMAYEDGPLPIGEGQTISQPYIVAIMTELLQLQGKERVLEIGTGSGYQAAILSQLVNKVYSIEIIKTLAEKADGVVDGLELHVSGDYSITDNYLPSGWEIVYNESMILMFSLDGSNLIDEKLFEYTGNMQIESAIIADFYGNSVPYTTTFISPSDYVLSSAYPNPFNPITTLSFSLPIDNEVTLKVYNLQGREVATLIHGNIDAGYHSVAWNANTNSSGVYFVKMVAGEYVNTQKLILIK